MQAATHVSYYSNLFREHHIIPREIDSIYALSAIPPLEKETLRARPEEFSVSNAISLTYAGQLTSGSTGTPLALKVDCET